MKLWVICIGLLLSVFSKELQATDQSTTLEKRVELLEAQVKALREELVAQKFRLKVLASKDSSVIERKPESVQAETAAGISRRDLRESSAKRPFFLTEFRAVPYFRDGEAIGLRLFAIKSNAALKKFGLRNGDIVKEVDGQGIYEHEATKSDIEVMAELLLKNTKSRQREILLERNHQDVLLTVPITD